LHVLPSLSASTDGGTGDLFSFSNGESSVGVPWTLGATVAFSKLGLTPEPLLGRMGERRNDRARVQKAAGACLDQCRTGVSTTDDEKTFCLAHEKQSASDLLDLDPDDLCVKGKKSFKASSPENEFRAARGLFPEWDISIGGAGGLSEMRYFKKQDDESMMYKDTSSVAPSMTLAFALTWVQQQRGHGHTIELPLSIGYRWDAQQAMGHYCPVKGTIGVDPVQKCADRSLGDPDKNLILNAAILSGIVDTDKGYWRLSMGPSVSYKSTGNEIHAHLEIPVYFNTSPLVSSGLNYQGIIRLTPAIGVSHDSQKGTAFEAVLTLDILGQRNLFMRALDWKH
jgi:hypothetical protein